MLILNVRTGVLVWCAELMFDAVDTNCDGLMSFEEFSTFIHAVTNVKSIIEQWKDIASVLSPTELASLPENTTLMAGNTIHAFV